MDPNDRASIQHQVLELDGRRYAVIAEDVLREVCQRAGLELARAGEATLPGPRALAGLDADNETLASRLVERRKRAGFSQVALARRAGIRVETLNRIERAKTTPDFATVRKLVVALNRADTVARKLTERRERAGLSQAALARRAGLRLERLDRIERARTTPDLATVRKLVVAIREAEAS